MPPAVPAVPQPSATASPTPAPQPPAAAAAAPLIPSTSGRIALFQVFDYHGGPVPPSAISSAAAHFNAVWGSTEPAAWTSAHAGIVASKYFIMGMDRYSDLHHTLSWWQANQPGWILYACDAQGHPTYDIAYMRGLNVADMPLDIHNPSVAQYQAAAMTSVARSEGYNALAMDQVVFWNTYEGGNPAFGQSVKSGEYGCGVWNGTAFARRYASAADPAWAQDVVGYVRALHAAAQAAHMPLIVNHPAGSSTNALEQQLLANTDGEMDETGFSDYGQYAGGGDGLFTRELAYMQYAQSRGVAFLVIDKYVQDATPTPAHLEYAIATYLMGNDGGALLFAGGANQYGTLQYHPEYAAPVGTACAAPAHAGDVYVRTFSGGLAIVNAGASPQSLVLPPGSYRDLEARAVTPDLSLAPHDAYVLLRSTGGC